LLKTRRRFLEMVITYFKVIFQNFAGKAKDIRMEYIGIKNQRQVSKQEYLSWESR
jgi:hypothetical protein